MLFRLVRPVRRSSSSMSQFVQRIPKDVRERAVGRSLSISIGSDTVHLTISPQAEAVRFSLERATRARRNGDRRRLRHILRPSGELCARIPRSRSPTAKRPLLLATCIEPGPAAKVVNVQFRDLRSARAASGSRTTASADNVPDFWESASKHLDAVEYADEEFQEEAERSKSGDRRPRLSRRPLERAFGADHRSPLARRGCPARRSRQSRDVAEGVSPRLEGCFRGPRTECRRRLRSDPSPSASLTLSARNRSHPNPRRSTSPRRLSPALSRIGGQKRTRADRKPSTHESYRNTMASLARFLGHDDASRVTTADILRFKDHRLATINPAR